MTFDGWNDELYHHGIKGMKWYVRRFQNEDGSLTPLGKRRYGEHSTEYVSAHRITKDYNKLDQGYANAVARANRARYIGEKLSAKAMKAGKSPKDIAKGDDRLSKKARSVFEKQKKAIRDMKDMEAMQYRILAKAAEQGLTVTSKPVKRYGTTGGDIVAQMLGGLIGGITYQAITKGSGQSVVSGSKIKASKTGDGSVVVYNTQAGKDYYEKRKRG